MNNIEFARKAENIAKNYKTAYMLGAFGFSCTHQNIKRLLNQYSDNYQWLKRSENIIGQGHIFDCVGLIKGIIWGWNGSDAVYGGATYASNGMPDIDADSLSYQCSSISSNFKNIEIGEVLLMPGHCGIYIGSGKAVEATPAWNGGVQISAVGNIGAIPGLPTRTWSTHGKLRLISYSAQNSVPSPTLSQNSTKVAYAQSFNKAYARTYTINAVGGLNIRTNAGVQYTKIKTLPNGSKVTCHGYYTLDSNKTKWYLVVAQDGTTGFVSSDFLK